MGPSQNPNTLYKEYLSRRKEALAPLAQIIGESEMNREMLQRVVDVVYWQGGEVELKLNADEFLSESPDGK